MHSDVTFAKNSKASKNALLSMPIRATAAVVGSRTSRVNNQSKSFTRSYVTYTRNRIDALWFLLMVLGDWLPVELGMRPIRATLLA